MRAILTLLSSHVWGIITVVFTAFVAPLAVESVKRHIADRSLYRVKATRAVALAGVWEGKGIDSNPSFEHKFDFDVRISLDYKNPRISGKGELRLEDRSTLDLDFEGSFHNENFVQLAYRNPAAGRVQLGVVLFRLSDIGTELEGIYAGYSPLRKQLVTGNIVLRKRTNEPNHSS